MSEIRAPSAGRSNEHVHVCTVYVSVCPPGRGYSVTAGTLYFFEQRLRNFARRCCKGLSCLISRANAGFVSRRQHGRDMAMPSRLGAL